MTQEGRNYLSSFIKTMNGDDAIIRIMKQNYLVDISQEDFDSLSLADDHVDGFLCNLSGADIVEAYAPFLSVLSEMVNRYGIDMDMLMERNEVYSLQREMFKNYVKTGMAMRSEYLLLSELHFEKKLFVEAMVNMLLDIAGEHSIFVLINNASQMCDSTMDILGLLQKKNSSGLKILLITSEVGNAKVYLKERYDRYILDCDVLGMVIDGVLEVDENTKKKDKSFVFRNSSKELDQIDNMISTMAMDQAEYYIELIYQKVEFEKVYVTAEYRMRMLALYIRTCIFKENHPYALILCDKYKTFTIKGKETQVKYYYYYYRALADMYIGNEEATADAQKCMEMAEKTGNKEMVFHSMLAYNMSFSSGWKNVWICNGAAVVPEGLIELCREYGYVNHLAHILVYSYHNESRMYEKPEGIEDRLPHIKEGIAIAKQLKNTSFLLDAYRKCIMMASCDGYFETSTFFYQKSIEIVQKSEDKFEEANIYNGLGYNCCTADRFEEANTYYNKALEIFYEEKNSDFVLETLYNMGLNAVLGCDYAHAVEDLTTVINVLKMLKKDRLRVCNIAKVLGLIAVAAYKMDNHYVAQIYHGKARQFLSHIIGHAISDFENYLWSDDMFLYYYVEALICTGNGKIREAFKAYEEAEVHLIQSAGSKFLNYALYATDKAKLLREIGMEREAVELLTDARDYYAGRGNAVRVEMFSAYINGDEWQPPDYVLDMKNVTIGGIIDDIRMESIERDLNSTKEQLRFFGTFQELVNNDYDSARHLMETLAMNFKMNFKLSHMVIIGCMGLTPRVDYSDLEYELPDEDVNKIAEYFRENTNGFALSDFSSNHGDYREILNMFSKSKISSIIAAPVYRFEKLHSVFITLIEIADTWNSQVERDILDDNDIYIYMIVFRQIADAVEKFKLNDRLKHQAVTDELTGLFNRNGYYKILDKFVAEAERRGEGNDITIMYMDLDHFKYYNDTFGHHVGDALLKKFAEIFVNACGNNGYVIRFGGDEFIILLDTVDTKIIDNTIRDIYRQIEEEGGFVEFVRKLKDSGIDIPDSCYANCSIGIEKGMNLNSIEGYLEIEKHADAALYYGKERERGRAVYYAEIKDSIKKA